MSLIIGVGDEIIQFLIVIFFIIILYLLANYFYFSLPQRIHITQLPIVESVRAELATTTATSTATTETTETTETTSATRSEGSDICPVCYDQLRCKTVTNCDHFFCGICIIAVWRHRHLSAINCPICRRNLTLLIAQPTTEESADPEIQQALSQISLFNRRFSNEPVSFWQRIQDMPALLNSFFRELSNPALLFRWLFNIRVIIIIFSIFGYILLPFDILPEQSLGLLGFIDDLIVVFCLLFYFALIIRNVISSRTFS
eukprot:TRINITY_DN4335_c0_g1_i1.p1 TRINITY_DN4335_c0_g1~~TRINITY_DN4335_c0_g1_i1.p1  ORF type:complete len:268 (-),score=78.78 TRINITY_DN4335_c0_g1_i1:36-809(-)